MEGKRQRVNCLYIHEANCSGTEPPVVMSSNNPHHLAGLLYAPDPDSDEDSGNVADSLAATTADNEHVQQ